MAIVTLLLNSTNIISNNLKSFLPRFTENTPEMKLMLFNSKVNVNVHS